MELRNVLFSQFLLLLARLQMHFRVSIYALESSSPMQKIAAWLTGRRPELIEPSILASAAGRECNFISYSPDGKNLLLKFWSIYSL